MIAEHTSHDDPDFSEESFDDLVRCPANSKSRFDLEEYDAAAQQRQHCNLFLHSAGVNRDLVEPPDKLRSATSTDPYRPPAQQAPAIAQQPEDLAADLYKCSTCVGDTFTVEDKDPSVLWRMRNDRIFNFWYYLMAACPIRWEFVLLPTMKYSHGPARR